jgi:hypothetical protein
MRMYGTNYLLYYIGGIVGSLMIFSLSKVLSALWEDVKLIIFIARNTIPIIAFNFGVYHLLSRVLPRIAGARAPQKPLGDLPPNILLSLLVLMLLLPVMYFSEKAFAYFKKQEPANKKTQEIAA